ncbi:hypothetical protein NYR95_19800 [Xanthomonas dyei]|uniref:Uncharacterized protein n=1 Tax=Xanthomonas dyei TaxID=743699 RepID=A0ABZ0DBA8_9XANT|nr:hypothetical protein [Xanthomonas dyei]WOB25892.1 hypothetical protein NYR99_19795 [Xanthomonas dyei]WOB53515.1 hypothetical protein NYR95_19800 [Xanthomonas dyei]
MPDIAIFVAANAQDDRHSQPSLLGRCSKQSIICVIACTALLAYELWGRATKAATGATSASAATRQVPHCHN